MEPFECRVLFPVLAAFLCVAVCRGQVSGLLAFENVVQDYLNFA